MKKVLVTGATGFLGRLVLQDLLAHGYETAALVRDERAKLPGKAARVFAALDAPDLADRLRGFDAIVHLAGKVSRAQADAAELQYLHVECTAKLLDAAAQAGVRRFVLASTSGTIAVSATPRRAATEDDNAPIELIGRWPYYISKWLQEQEVLRRDAKDQIEAVVLNPSLLLGPGDDRGSSNGDVLKILHGRFPALTRGTVAFTDVRDVAPMVRAALERGRRGQRYLLNGANLSLPAFVDRIERAGKVHHFRPVLAPRWALLGAKLIEGVAHVAGVTSPVDAVSVEMAGQHWGCSAEKAVRELRFSARDPQRTLIDTVRDLERIGLFRQP